MRYLYFKFKKYPIHTICCILLKVISMRVSQAYIDKCRDKVINMIRHITSNSKTAACMHACMQLHAAVACNCCMQQQCRGPAVSPFSSIHIQSKCIKALFLFFLLALFLVFSLQSFGFLFLLAPIVIPYVIGRSLHAGVTLDARFAQGQPQVRLLGLPMENCDTFR